MTSCLYDVIEPNFGKSFAGKLGTRYIYRRGQQAPFRTHLKKKGRKLNEKTY